MANDALNAGAVADPARFDRAIASIDAANALDPNRETVGGRERPKELVYAERMTAMLRRFAPDASEILRLAVRCQHIQRWTIARSEYAMDRIGYLQWRKRLYKFHAQTAGDILRDAGYDEATIERVGTLLKKEGIKSDADVQTLEDVVDLVFLESYLADFVARHGQYDLAKFTDILAKTAKKMSARGRESAVTLIDAPADLAPLIRSVMQAAEAA
ncbi:MAG TPA: DUF4202 domain-containing protein [Casimicrobiaceae bacterium]